MNSIDDEWNAYLENIQIGKMSSGGFDDAPTKRYGHNIHTNKHVIKNDDDIHEKSIFNTNINSNIDSYNVNDPNVDKTQIPECEELYISTKTKVLFLNQEIDIQNVFWEIPIIEYWRPTIGVVKKQMKIVSKTKDEYEIYKKRLENINYYNEHVIKQIDNPTARRIKFKDERKLTIGLSKKDIMNCRGKIKNAFYNCFAIIIRFKYNDSFREIHVKIFNTGKLEIPGILNVELLEIVKELILNLIKQYVNKPLEFVEINDEDNVLINSNFNCGFFINREKLHTILRSDKYHIESAYDPCSYPGVKCKFYFNNEIGFDLDRQNGRILQQDRALKMSELDDNKKYTEISFMIFRTGSCLIVGNCSENILKFVFEYIKHVLTNEYHNIHVLNEEPVNKNKKTKLRKKMVFMTKPYYIDAVSM